MTINILKALETHPWKFNKSFFVCVRSELLSVLQCDDGPPSLRYLPWSKKRATLLFHIIFHFLPLISCPQKNCL